MGKIAFIFAGQGAQYPGMGKELAQYSPAAEVVFRMADSLRPGTSGQCFDGEGEALFQTVNTQPCLFAMDLACAAALNETGIRADGAAGFSLGEIPALAYAGLLSARDAFALVMRRAELMQRCAEENPGAMVAVLRLSAEEVEELCGEFDRVWPVNYNGPGQTVAAGDAAQIDRLILRVGERKGRAVKINVSGAFHSPFMESAAQGLTEYLKGCSFAAPSVPLYANLTASPYGENPAAWVAAQVKSPVLWQKTVEKMIGDGFDTFIEVGAGKTLSGLVKKISGEVTVCNVEDWSTLRAAVDTITGIKN